MIEAGTRPALTSRYVRRFVTASLRKARQMKAVVGGSILMRLIDSRTVVLGCPKVATMTRRLLKAQRHLAA